MHSNDPAKNIPTNTFAEAMSVGPDRALRGSSGASTGTFKVKLMLNGVFVGYLGQNSTGWAVLATNEGDAVSLEWYPYDGVEYIRIAGSSAYMSVGTTPANNAYVGFYGWSGASGWTLSGRRLTSAVNEQKMSIYSTDNAYIFCWDEYSVLDVEIVT